jgi:alpha-1,3(6)-mannosylglycoprotein beta-1,6-N-acetyl-glucosaminyltransferase
MKLAWIKARITSMWPNWQKSANILATKLNSGLVNTPVKKVLLHLGLISDNAGFKIAETAFHGGPLGELVQWADLIASLYLLGHKLTISYEIQHLQGYFRYSKVAACPGPKTGDEFDIVFIDIVGLRQLKKAVGGKFDQLKCRFRVLDSFGTEPEFNLARYQRPGSRGDWGQAWGNWNLNPRQFWTMFPHSPDNSFLGFVVDHEVNIENMAQKKNQSLVYGKELDMWKERRVFLDIIHEYTNVHATIGTTKNNKVDGSLVPPYVTNHGVLDRNGIQQLLQETKVFVGLGFPYEGPAPLEAIANGCIFLNPKFSPPVSRINTQHFKLKPTLRALTSQHPYAEVFIGKPHVYTIDINDANAVRQAMEEISKINVPPYLPYEYTQMGLLERISAYINNQDFCNPGHQWPPLSALDIHVAKKGQSCQVACLDRGLVCEPEFFTAINKEAVFKSLSIRCSAFSSIGDIVMPSFEDGQWICFLQAEPMLFSCVGEHSDRTRICPCRKYVKGQVALCTECH